MAKTKYLRVLQAITKHDKPITAKRIQAWLDCENGELTTALQYLFSKGLIKKEGKEGTSNLYFISELGKTLVPYTTITIHVSEHVNLERIR